MRGWATLLLFMLAAYVGPETGFRAPPDAPRRLAAGASPGRASDEHIAAILAPRRRAVLAAEVTGRVVAVNKELGEPFDRGGILAQLDDARYKSDKRMAQAMFTSATAQLVRIRKLSDDKTRERHAEAVLTAARANLAATQRLYNDNHASLIELENAKRDVTVAQTNRELVDSTSAKELIDAQHELAIAAGRLDIASDHLEACTMTAPWAGRVARVLVNEHELVKQGTPVIEVIDDRILLVKFLLPSSVFSSVHLGRTLTLEVTETARTVVVTVSHIAAALDPVSVTFEVHAEIDNENGALRAGMNGLLSLAEIEGG